MGMPAEEKAAWLSARAGKLTASRMADALAMTRDNKPAASRNKLMMELLAERVSDHNVSHVVTEPMLHGIEYEDEAADMFVARTGRSLRRSRFYDHPTIENFGATPDRELEDGIVEIKCPTTTKFLSWVLAGVVPEEHKLQMTAQILCTGKMWCGFIAYDPRIRDESKRLFMRKYVPSIEETLLVEVGAIQFLKDLDTMFEQFTTAV